MSNIKNGRKSGSSKLSLKQLYFPLLFVRGGKLASISLQIYFYLNTLLLQLSTKQYPVNLLLVQTNTWKLIFGIRSYTTSHSSLCITTSLMLSLKRTEIQNVSMCMLLNQPGCFHFSLQTLSLLKNIWIKMCFSVPSKKSYSWIPSPFLLESLPAWGGVYQWKQLVCYLYLIIKAHLN